MASFFDLFPIIGYDIAKEKYSNYQYVKNIFYRTAFLKDVLENISAYYEYVINDNDKPEILAEKLYGNPNAYWIILYANNMLDAQYDWPLNNKGFSNYIISKYGSIANSQTTIHHYEKVVSRTESLSGITSEFKYVVDYNSKTNSIINMSDVTGAFSNGEAVYQGSNLAYATFSANVIYWNSTASELTLANNIGQVLRYNELVGDSSSANGTVASFNSPDVPYDYYLNLPATQGVSTYDVSGKTVTEIISRNAVSNYDYELDLNEKKRFIKIIKPEYYGSIMREFQNLTGNEQNFYRRLS
jgi:hypothetical protein